MNTKPARKPRLTSRRGWFRVERHDLELLREHTSTPAALAVWIAMLDLANGSRGDSFTANIALIAHKARIGYRTAWAMIRELETLKLISQIRDIPDNGRQPQGPSTFTILTPGYATDASPVCKRRRASFADKDQESPKVILEEEGASQNRAASLDAQRREDTPPEEKKQARGPRAWFTEAGR